MSVAVQSSVFIPDCIQGQAGRNHRIVSRAEPIEQAIVAVRTPTVHAMSGIGIVGRDEGILLQWERDDGGGFICVHVVPCVNSPEHQLALTALGSTKE